MKLSEAMKEKMLLSFEVFPPKTEKGMENLPGTIEHLMKYKPEYISCTYGAGGGNVGANREVCQMIKKAGTTPVTHFTVIKNTKEGKHMGCGGCSGNCGSCGGCAGASYSASSKSPRMKK